MLVTSILSLSKSEVEELLDYLGYIDKQDLPSDT